MIDGSDKLDISSCASQKPISGFNPNTGLNLVRNPNYDPATDDTEIRQSNPDRFEISVNTNLDDIFAKIERGELEGSFETPPNAVLRRYLQDPEIRERLRVNSGDRIWFVYMNLTTPPFDDVHVRKAMNLVMDLEGIQRAWGGPVQGSIPTDVLPDTMMPDAHRRQLRAVPAAAVRGRRRGGQGRDEAVEVRHRQGRHLRRRRPARASCTSTATSPRGRRCRRSSSSRRPRSASSSRPARRRARPSTTPPAPGAQDPDQLRQRLGQGLRRPVHVHGAVRRPQHHRRAATPPSPSSA